MKKNNIEKSKYYMYKHDESDNWKKWWTTDESIISEFKLAHTYEIIGAVMFLVGLLSFIATLIFAGLEILIGLIMSIVLIPICIFAGVGFLNISSNIFRGAESAYFKTTEYKKLKIKYDKEEKKQLDNVHREKAKKLVEMYDIIDSKEHTQEERIELLKNYM